MEDNPSTISHVSIGTNHFDQACRFYDQVLKIVGCKRVMEFPGAVAYGKKQSPEFCVQTPIDGQKAAVGNGSHIGFIAKSKAIVDQFYKTALAAGGKDSGAPGPRPEDSEAYYSCYVKDLDGHKIEAVYWDATKL